MTDLIWIQDNQPIYACAGGDIIEVLNYTVSSVDIYDGNVETYFDDPRRIPID